MPTSDVRTLRVSYEFDVPAEEVFAAWVDPSLASRWLFTTPAGEIVRCDIDAREGGRFTIVDRRSGEDVEHVGQYEQVAPPARLVFTFSVPKYSAAVSRVAIEVAPRAGGGSRLTLVQDGVPAEWAEQTETGWRGLLAACARQLIS
jgi:uncharacterized protein YndB with AHSA1/START domain